MLFPAGSLRLAALVCFFAVMRSLFADSVTLSLAPVADTTLFATLPDYNLGGLATVIAGTTFLGQSNRALLRFDVSSIPTHALLQSARLTVTVTRTTAVESNLFRLRRLVQDWGEGTGSANNSGNPAQAGEATWADRFYPDAPWSEAGAGAPGDYVPEVSAEQNLGGPGVYDFGPSPGLLADVQFWRTNAAGNHGWLLECADEAQAPTSRRIASREDPTNFPLLTISYALPDRQQIDLSPVADTSLFEYRPFNNLGATELAAGAIGLFTNRARALIRFDFIDEVPPEAIITAARLRLVVTRVGGGPGSGTGSNFGLHRLLTGWGEGNKDGILGAEADPGEANWFARFSPEALWSQPGAAAPDDYVAAASDTQFIGDLGPWVFSNALDDVRFWLAQPESNFGWILIGDAEDVPRTARRFASRDDPVNGPVLHVEYLMPPQVTRVQVAGGQMMLSFGALALSHYAIESAASPGGPWTTATNLPLLGVSGPVTVPVPLDFPPRFFRVRLDY